MPPARASLLSAHRVCLRLPRLGCSRPRLLNCAFSPSAARLPGAVGNSGQTARIHTSWFVTAPGQKCCSHPVSRADEGDRNRAGSQEHEDGVMAARRRKRRMKALVTATLTAIPFTVFPTTASAFFPPIITLPPPVVVVPPVVVPP